MKASKIIQSMSLLAVFVLGGAVQAMAQIELPEIEVTAARYEYLNSVNPKDVAKPVSMAEYYASAYDLEGAEFYEDEYDNYFVSFFIPKGKILAAYDKDGNLLRTAEKYENVKVPAKVSEAVATRYPNWSIAKDVYLVSYHSEKGKTVVNKVYKLVLENGNKRMRVKVNDAGEFL